MSAEPALTIITLNRSAFGPTAESVAELQKAGLGAGSIANSLQTTRRIPTFMCDCRLFGCLSNSSSLTRHPTFV
jgi:hypothetical protein